MFFLINLCANSWLIAFFYVILHAIRLNDLETNNYSKYEAKSIATSFLLGNDVYGG